MFLSRKMKYWLAALVILIHTIKTNASALAQAPAAPAPQGPAGSMNILMLIVPLFLIFYFLIIRPQQKQAKQRQAMVDAVKKGDTVVTTGGIYGRVVGVTDNVLTVEIADNCKIKLERSGIATVKSVEAAAS